MNTQDNQQQAPRLRITEREHMKGRDEHGHEIRWFSRYDELAVCHGVFVSIDGKEYEKADNETAQRMFLRLTVPQTKREALARIDQEIGVLTHNREIWQKISTRQARAQIEYLTARINALEQSRKNYL